MRTRRVIRCRRTAVAIGTTSTGAPVDLPVPEMPPVPPGYEGLTVPPLFGSPSPEHGLTSSDRGLTPSESGPAPDLPSYLADPGPVPTVPTVPTVPGPARPWRANRGPDLPPGPTSRSDLTLADLARSRPRNLDWNRNPGWPPEIGWTHIAQSAHGRSPRHARTARRWRLPRRAARWIGIGLVAASVLLLIATLR
jgi:hypothetical protein